MLLNSLFPASLHGCKFQIPQGRRWHKTVPQWHLGEETLMLVCVGDKDRTSLSNCTDGPSGYYNLNVAKILTNRCEELYPTMTESKITKSARMSRVPKRILPAKKKQKTKKKNKKKTKCISHHNEWRKI